MAGRPRTRARKERLAALLARTDALDALCGWIANGGTLSGFAREHDVPYSELEAWLAAAPERAQRYVAALGTRGRYLDEHAVDKIVGLSDVDPAEAFDELGRLKPIHEIPAPVRRAIAGLETEEETRMSDDGMHATHVRTVKIRWVNPLDAAQALAKYRRLLADRVEIDVYTHDALEQLVDAWRDALIQLGLFDARVQALLAERTEAWLAARPAARSQPRRLSAGP